MAPAGDLQLGIDIELDPETKQGSVVLFGTISCQRN